MTLFKKALIAILFVSLSMVSFNCVAANKFTSNTQVKKFIKEMSSKYKMSSSYLNSLFNQAHYESSVIPSMQKPAEAEPWYIYQKNFITPERVKEGIKFYQQQRKVLKMEEDSFGVPGSIIVAILGVETNYGQDIGNYRVFDTIATLAFYYPSRAQYFKGELRDLILYAKQQKVSPLSFYGSYAGAMGMPQFMPTSMLEYAMGFSNPHKPNIFTNGSDAIFSVGNYLMQKGWERNEPIAEKAKVVGDKYKQVLKTDSRKPMEPDMSLAEMQKYGVYSTQHFNLNDVANLMQFQDKNGDEYWLGFHNFYVITRYNSSDLYALAVFELAQKIQQGWDQYQHEQQQKQLQQKSQSHSS